MITQTQEKSASNATKTLREVIIDIIAKRTGGVAFHEIITVMRNYWVRADGKEITNASVSNHLLKMVESNVLIFEERSSTRPGGKTRYYSLNKIPTDPDTSKLTLVTTGYAESLNIGLPPLSWAAPRQHIARKPNPLHQKGDIA